MRWQELLERNFFLCLDMTWPCGFKNILLPEITAGQHGVMTSFVLFMENTLPTLQICGYQRTVVSTTLVYGADV